MQRDCTSIGRVAQPIFETGAKQCYEPSYLTTLIHLCAGSISKQLALSRIARCCRIDVRCWSRSPKAADYRSNQQASKQHRPIKVLERIKQETLALPRIARCCCIDARCCRDRPRRLTTEASRKPRSNIDFFDKFNQGSSKVKGRITAASKPSQRLQVSSGRSWLVIGRRKMLGAAASSGR